MEGSQKLDSAQLEKLTPQELRLYKLYGKLPSTKDILNHKLKDNRKFFDSGDYHMKKEQEKQDNRSSSNTKEHELRKIVPVHHLEQIKASKRRMSSTVAPTAFSPETAKVETNTEVADHETIVTASQNSGPGTVPVVSPRTRSNSILNPQSLSNSPLGK